MGYKVMLGFLNAMWNDQMKSISPSIKHLASSVIRTFEIHPPRDTKMYSMIYIHHAVQYV